MKLTERDKAVQPQIVAELDSMVKLYGFDQVRRVCNRYLKTLRLQARTKREIAELEKKLAALKAKAPR